MTGKPTLDRFDPETGTTLVALTRETVARTAHAESVEGLPEAEYDLPDIQTGVFVTLKRGDRLRGCIGRVEATSPVADAVAGAAADASRNDPRMEPVGPDEVGKLRVTVSLLTAPATVDDDLRESVVVGRDGLVVRRGPRQGLLLPQVATERDWDVETFLAETCLKARLPRDAWQRDAVTVDQFTARTFAEQEPGGTIEVTLYDVADAGDDGPPTETLPRDSSDGTPVTDGGESVRPPSVAGQFYAGDESGLREQLAATISDDHGPGSVAAVDSADIPRVVVSPHAGYPYSGPIAAHGFAALASGNEPDAVVVLGPNHDGMGARAATASYEAWQTPLGELPVDGDLRDSLLDQSDLVSVDDAALGVLVHAAGTCGCTGSGGYTAHYYDLHNGLLYAGVLSRYCPNCGATPRSINKLQGCGCFPVCGE